MLVQQYLINTTLGVEYALNVELSIHKVKDYKRDSELISSAINLLLSIFIILFILTALYKFTTVQFFEKYDFKNFSIEIFFLVCVAELQQIFSNICRAYERLDLIIVYEFVFSFLPFMAIFFFQGNELIHAELTSMIIAGMIGNYLFFKKTPFVYSFLIDLSLIKKLILIGIPLLLYNFSFNLILIASRTIISIYYSVEEMGLFSFANSLSGAILLGISSIAWVIFPKVLSKLSNDEDGEFLKRNTQFINEIYSLAVLLLIFISILVLPIIFVFLKEYKAIEPVLVILLLTQGILSTSFAYNSLAIAKKKHLKVALLSFLSVIIIVIFSFICAFLKLNIIWIAISTFIGVALFSILQIILSSKLLGENEGYTKILISIYPIHNIFIIGIFLISDSLPGAYMIKFIGFVLFVFFNRKKITKGINFAKSLI